MLCWPVGGARERGGFFSLSRTDLTVSVRRWDGVFCGARGDGDDCSLFPLWQCKGRGDGGLFALCFGGSWAVDVSASCVVCGYPFLTCRVYHKR